MRTISLTAMGVTIGISIGIGISPAFARILNVPEDYQTIQAGIDAVEEGDTVLVAPRRGYFVRLSFRRATPFTLASRYLLDGNERFIGETSLTTTYGDSSILTFESQVTRETRVVGFTIERGFSEYGGGINCRGGSPSLEWLRIQFGGAENEGGGVYVQGNANPILLNCKITHNRSGYGGGIAVDYRARCEMKNCYIGENEAGARGGGVFFAHNSMLTMTDCNVVGNINQGWGAAIYGWDGAGLMFEGGSIIGNIPREGQQIIGGAISLASAGATFRNALIVGNIGQGAVAAGVGDRNSNLTIESCTIANNIDPSETPSQFNGAFGALYIANSILWDLGESVPTIGESWRSSVTFNNIRDFQEDNFRATHLSINDNIDSDPLFADPDNGDYSLTADSPCIDAGDPDADPDPDGTRADIGAFYFHQRDIEVEPDEIVFPPVGWGELDSLPAEIRNVGGNILHINAIVSPLDMNCIFFRPDGYFDPPLEIEPDSSLTIWFYIRPDSAASLGGSVFIYSDDPDEDSLVIETRGEPPSSVPSTPFSAFDFQLYPAYPNPFNSSTSIRFSMGSQAAPARLAVYDLSGRLVDTLWNRPGSEIENQKSEIRSVVWNADALPGGIYLIRLQSGSEIQTIKAVLIK